MEGEEAVSSLVTLRTRWQQKNKISLWDLGYHGRHREDCYVIVLWDITPCSDVDRQQGVVMLLLFSTYEGQNIKGKVVLVTDRGGLNGCETSRLPQFVHIGLNNREVSLTLRLTALNAQEDSWFSYVLGAESTPGP